MIKWNEMKGEIENRIKKTHKIDTALTEKICLKLPTATVAI